MDGVSHSNTILFESYSFAYIGIPKAANSSVKKVLAPLVGVDFSEAVKAKNIHNREKYPFNYKSSKALSKKIDGLFVFTVVRNPWDRLVSSYNDKVCRANIHPPLLKLGMYTGMPFEEYVDIISVTKDQDLDIHLRSQTSLIFHDGRLMPNLILRMENLNSHWKSCAKIIEGFVGKDLPEMLISNSKKHRYYGEYYTRATKNKVGDRFSSDVTLFGYDF
ncbi:sulfotransferase family protein [Microbulbifer sp. MKSA007]|nr:sulfotransferase family protein [Microbulbifer sp. MKSA007]